MSSTRATTCCTSVGCCVEEWTKHVAVLARDRERDLAFEIEMLLPADAKRSFEPVRRACNGGIDIAAAERIIRHDGFAALQGVARP